MGLSRLTLKPSVLVAGGSGKIRLGVAGQATVTVPPCSLAPLGWVVLPLPMEPLPLEQAARTTAAVRAAAVASSRWMLRMRGLSLESRRRHFRLTIPTN